MGEMNSNSCMHRRGECTKNVHESKTFMNRFLKPRSPVSVLVDVTSSSTCDGLYACDIHYAML